MGKDVILSKNVHFYILETCTGFNFPTVTRYEVNLVYMYSHFFLTTYNTRHFASIIASYFIREQLYSNVYLA